MLLEESVSRWYARYDDRDLTRLLSSHILAIARYALEEIGNGGKLFGAPLIVWGALCFALTVVWIITWPSGKAAATEGLRFVILRWFHALVWLFLAIAAFLAAFNVLGGTATARALAFLSLITYLVFVATFITTR